MNASSYTHRPTTPVRKMVLEVATEYHGFSREQLCQRATLRRKPAAE